MKALFLETTVKKIIAAATVGLLLVAGQATAANNNSGARVGDRIGASAGESSEFAGVPLAAILLTAAAVAFVVVGVSNDDRPSSN